MKTKYLSLCLAACTVSVQGGPRGSADYSLAAETTDSGGHHAASTNYANDGSAGLVAGLATASAPAETAKAGYIGQLYEVTGLAVNASPASVDETATRQLAAWQLLDDDSHLAVSATSVAWSVVSGPLSGISAAGLATADKVSQDTPASVQGSYGSLTGLFDLTVLNVLPDNFGSYAGDGLDDSWQIDYFGLDNPDAGPLMDPDGDGQDNEFEFTAGLIPTDPLSRFLLRVEPVAGAPARKRLVFSPRWTDRTYDILTSTTLEPGTWSELAAGEVSDIGNERSVTDPNAGAGRKFYRVQVVKP